MSGTEQQGKQGFWEREQPWGEQLRRLLLIVAASVVMAANIKSFVDAGGLFPGGFTFQHLKEHHLRSMERRKQRLKERLNRNTSGSKIESQPN